jgi:hypothetical protein
MIIRDIGQEIRLSKYYQIVVSESRFGKLNIEPY